MLDNQAIAKATTWVLPVLIAITFHEAAHGFVARMRGDDTAAQLGRVTLNPFKHVDLFGTVLLPAMLLLLSDSRFLFGYAKPVPVDFRRLHNPRLDMVWVAAAGPAMNIALAILAALLLFHFISYVPAGAALWVKDNLQNALTFNVLLAVFNMLPLPPLDGGRIAVGLLPDFLAWPLARLEPYGMLILIAVLIVLPLIGNQLGMNLDVYSYVIGPPFVFLRDLILRITGLA